MDGSHGRSAPRQSREGAAGAGRDSAPDFSDGGLDEGAEGSAAGFGLRVGRQPQERLQSHPGVQTGNGSYGSGLGHDDSGRGRGDPEASQASRASQDIGQDAQSIHGKLRVNIGRRMSILPEHVPQEPSPYDAESDTVLTPPTISFKRVNRKAVGWLLGKRDSAPRFLPSASLSYDLWEGISRQSPSKRPVRALKDAAGMESTFLQSRADATISQIVWTVCVSLVLAIVLFSLGLWKGALPWVVTVVSGSVSPLLLRLLVKNNSEEGTENVIAVMDLVLHSAFILSACVSHLLVALEWGGGGGDVAIFSILAPLTVLFSRPKDPMRTSCAFLVSRTILAAIVLVLGHVLPPFQHDTDHPRGGGRPTPPHKLLVLVLFSHVFCVGLVAVMYRYYHEEFIWVRSLAERLKQEAEVSQIQNARLICSLFPPGKASCFVHQQPEKWFQIEHDELEDCSVLQMDIKGFTALSSTISADELVDLINAIFTGVDEAADSIGSVWKVETIGDCYKAVVGGYDRSEDHVLRATVLACAILDIVQIVAKKLGLIELSVRCGVACGPVTGAVVGRQMPRYMIYGTTCEEAGLMEKSAESGQVLLSEAAWRRLPPEPAWTAVRGSVKDKNGDEVVVYHLSLDRGNRAAMLHGEWGGQLKSLLRLLSDDDFVGLSMSQSLSKSQENDIGPLYPLRLPSLFKGMNLPSLSNSSKPVSPKSVTTGDGRAKPVVGRRRSSTGSVGSSGSVRRSSEIRPVNEAPLVAASSRANHLSPIPRLFPAPERRSPLGALDRRSVFGGIGARSPLHGLTASALADGSSPFTILAASAKLRRTSLQPSIEEEAAARSAELESNSEGKIKSENAEGPRFGRVLSDSGVPLRDRLDIMAKGWALSASMESSVPKGSSDSKKAHTQLNAFLSNQHLKNAGLGDLGQRTFELQRSPSSGIPEPTLPRAGNSSRDGTLRSPGPSMRTNTQGNDFATDTYGAGMQKQDASSVRDVETLKGGRQGFVNTSQELFEQSSLTFRFTTASFIELLKQLKDTPMDHLSVCSRRMIQELTNHPESKFSPLEQPGVSSTRRMHSPLAPQALVSMDSSIRRKPRFEEEDIETQDGTVNGTVTATLHGWMQSTSNFTNKRDTQAAVIQWFLCTILFSSTIATVIHLSIPSDADTSYAEHSLTAEGMRVHAIRPAIFAVAAGAMLWAQRREILIGSNHGAGDDISPAVRCMLLGFFMCSPVAFLGDLSYQAMSTSSFWAVFPLVLIPESRIMTLAGYLGIYIIFSLAIAVSLNQHDGPLCGAPNSPSCPPWAISFAVLNHLVPSTMVLVPILLMCASSWHGLEESMMFLRDLTKTVMFQRKILHSILPLPISRRLQAGETIIADRYRKSTVMFVYLPYFDQIMVDYGTRTALEWLNQVYAELDRAVSPWAEPGARPDKRGVFKVETFNNFYMAVSGCDDSYSSHADDAVLGAVNMIARVSKVMQPDGQPTVVKIGLNSGSICAGVIGITSPRFSVFGDTCNIASRMASHSDSCSGGSIFVNMSAETAGLVSTQCRHMLLSVFQCVLSQRDHLVEVKGKGAMETWYVERLSGTTRRLEVCSLPDAHKRFSDGSDDSMDGTLGLPQDEDGEIQIVRLDPESAVVEVSECKAKRTPDDVSQTVGLRLDGTSDREDGTVWDVGDPVTCSSVVLDLQVDGGKRPPQGDAALEDYTREESEENNSEERGGNQGGGQGRGGAGGNYGAEKGRDKGQEVSGMHGSGAYFLAGDQVSPSECTESANTGSNFNTSGVAEGVIEDNPAAAQNSGNLLTVWKVPHIPECKEQSLIEVDDDAGAKWGRKFTSSDCIGVVIEDDNAAHEEAHIPEQVLIEVDDDAGAKWGKKFTSSDCIGVVIEDDNAAHGEAAVGPRVGSPPRRRYGVDELRQRGTGPRLPLPALPDDEPVIAHLDRQVLIHVDENEAKWGGLFGDRTESMDSLSAPLRNRRNSSLDSFRSATSSSGSRLTSCHEDNDLSMLVDSHSQLPHILECEEQVLIEVDDDAGAKWGKKFTSSDCIGVVIEDDNAAHGEAAVGPRVGSPPRRRYGVDELRQRGTGPRLPLPALPDDEPVIAHLDRQVLIHVDENEAKWGGLFGDRTESMDSFSSPLRNRRNSFLDSFRSVLVYGYEDEGRLRAMDSDRAPLRSRLCGSLDSIRSSTNSTGSRLTSCHEDKNDSRGCDAQRGPTTPTNVVAWNRGARPRATAGPSNRISGNANGLSANSISSERSAIE